MFRTRLVVLLLTLFFTCIGQAQETSVKTFNSGSYQQILSEYSGHAFVLAIWSVDCPSCLKDMDVIHELHQKHPGLKIVMLSTDEPVAVAEVEDILTKHRLIDLDNWMFGNEDAQKLRYEIDPRWYGELPRTYFFTSSHKRTGTSGALKIEELEAQIATIKP
ncbi:TlpA family protein disulfide reductase [Methylomonas sp. MgM2]